MAKMGGLGRGLDALMGEQEPTTNTAQADISPVSQIAQSTLPAGIEQDKDGGLWVSPALLKANPRQPRQEFDEQALQELSNSIKEHGVVQPIIIEPAGEKNFFIIAGERRARAAKMAGLSRVPVRINRFTEQKKLEVALIENIQRSDLNPIEEASAYYNLMQLGNLSQDEVAKRVGKNRSTVANALRLLKLPEDIRNALVSGTISAGHARAILSTSNDSDMHILFAKIVGNSLSVREAESLASSMNENSESNKKSAAKKSSEKKNERDPDIIAIEQQLIERLGTKCSLNGNFEKGTLTISYFSRADLDRLYNAIIGE
ncbi:MAG: ParB/RepB/Spo0J family partition protein [Treponema sp.]|nr:ParB/RepB/Spo0J family partition protein [Treponema sp.]